MRWFRIMHGLFWLYLFATYLLFLAIVPGAELIARLIISQYAATFIICMCIGFVAVVDGLKQFAEYKEQNGCRC